MTLHFLYEALNLSFKGYILSSRLARRGVGLHYTPMRPLGQVGPGAQMLSILGLAGLKSLKNIGMSVWVGSIYIHTLMIICII